jgi:GT2 family glycosyltransferase
MVIKKEVVQHIGLFDERYFAYQEDSDYCLRAKKSGWKVYYNPTVLVTHKGGAGGSQTVPMKAIFEWHRSYYRYYFKHFSKNYSLIFNLFYCLIMLFKLIISEILYLTKA